MMKFIQQYKQEFLAYYNRLKDNLLINKFTVSIGNNPFQDTLYVPKLVKELFSPIMETLVIEECRKQLAVLITATKQDHKTMVDQITTKSTTKHTKELFQLTEQLGALQEAYKNIEKQELIARQQLKELFIKKYIK